MTHWGWYWKHKKKHSPKKSCESGWLCELDSFSTFRNREIVQLVKESADKISFTVPKYNLIGYIRDDDSFFVTFTDGSYEIKSEKVLAHYGGHFYFFCCPQCNKRIRKLYCIEGKYLCRQCGNLAYYKQRMRPSDRFALMALKIKNFVKNRAGNIESNIKPPRMHRKTFEKLKALYLYYTGKHGLALFKELREWKGPGVERWLDKWFEYEWTMDIQHYEKKYTKNNYL